MPEQIPKPKRRLRAPQQTVRERSQAAREIKPAKPARLAPLKRTIAKPFHASFAFLGRFKTMRLVERVLKFIGRIIVPNYLRNSWREIKLVTWPTRRESRRLTVAVIGFAVVFGALVAILDYGLSHLFKAIILGKH